MKKNKREYRIVLSNRLSHFIRKVNTSLQLGWKCQGGVAVSLIDNEEWYYQSMTRRIK